MTGGLSMWQMLFDTLGKPLLIGLLPIYLFALIKGDKSDRLCAHVLAIGAGLDLMLALHQQASGQRWLYRGDQLIIDVLLLAAQTFIATRSSRRYPIVIAAAQLILVVTEMLNWAGLIAHEETLSALIEFDGIIQLSAFAGGLIVSSSRRRNRAAAPAFEH